MSPLLNGSPLSSDICQTRFPFSEYVGHPEAPLEVERGPSQIRTHPHTATRARET